MARKSFLMRLAALAAYGVILTVYWILDLPCGYIALFGFPCPGCGMTRAWLAALRGDFAAAFGFHPMFWSVPLVFAYLLIPGQWIKHRRLCNGILAVIGLGFLVFWLTKIL